MKMITSLAVVMVLALTPACSGRETGAGTPSETNGGAYDTAAPAAPGDLPEPPPTPQTALPGGDAEADSSLLAIAELCTEERPADAIVSVSGQFHGFRVEGCSFPVCVAPASLTRSDWLLRTGGDCAYVTGGTPQGVDPIDPSFAGRRVQIRARVVEDSDGKLRLSFLGGRLLDE